MDISHRQEIQAGKLGGTRALVISISAPVIAFALVGGLLGKVMAREETFQHLKPFDDVVNFITGNYVEEVKVDKVMHGAMRGLAAGAAALYDGHHGAPLATITTVNDVRNFAFFLSIGVLGVFTLAVAGAGGVPGTAAPSTEGGG